MSKKTKWALMLAILLWSSAFVGIRAALHDYSPGGLALLRYLVASVCMGVIYFSLPTYSLNNLKDKILLMGIGAFGIGGYNIALNYGELTVTPGLASFIIRMSPVVAALLAVVLLREKLNIYHLLGLFVSVIGVTLIMFGQESGFHWSMSLSYVLLATLAGSAYTVLQKTFSSKYKVMEITAYVIWGGALFLLIYVPSLITDLQHASIQTTAIVVYLGVFPAAIGYLAWSVVLSEISASRAVTFLYAQPFIVTFLGWIWLGEIPALISVAGGLLAIAGAWLVNASYQRAEV